MIPDDTDRPRSPDDNGDSADLERMLEERARLDERIRRDFTRTITVMFTDFKGSTALAEAEGDMASRLLIKRHHDMLFPILAGNRGVLVKTMGDGTLSWFERARDGVAAAVEFQRALKAFNRSRPGKTPIVVRIGLNTGTGIVEADDVFGDAVNVAARFEALASPGEICISESCYDALEDPGSFRCQYWKMAELKGKSGLHKIFRAHWDPDAKPDEAVPETPSRPGGPSARTDAPGRPPTVVRGLGHPFRSPLLFRPGTSEPKRRPDTAWIQEEREALAGATVTLSSVTIRRGDTRRLAGEAYRVLGDVVVEDGGLLVIDGARLFFEEGAGIVVAGAIRARNALFSAADSSRGWRNVSVDPGEERMSLFERCTFRFGRGRSIASLPALLDGGSQRMNEGYLCGGGLLVRGGTEKSIPVDDCAFHHCSAHEGGGAMLFRTKAVLSGCTFEHCTAGVTGGGASCLDGSPVLRNCVFRDCSAALGGGGAAVRASRASFDGCAFERCSTGHLHGGGLYCTESSPAVSGCRFVACGAGRDAGGIYRDEASAPRVANTAFSGCTPSDTNLPAGGR